MNSEGSRVVKRDGLGTSSEVVAQPMPPDAIRRQYTAPSLVRLGTVEDVTAGSNVSGSDTYGKSAGGG